LAVAVLAFAWLYPGQALATHVSCGDTITQDTTLDNDLIDCSGAGIVIGADNITLDLGGHTVDARQFTPETDAGIINSAGHSGVTVTDGVVREFDHGIHLSGATSNRVSRLTVLNSLLGIYLTSSHNNEITHNGVSGAAEAIALDLSADKRDRTQLASACIFGLDVNILSRANLVARNSIADVTATAIQIDDASESSRVVRNRILDSPVGIDVKTGCNRNQIDDNSVLRASFLGIRVFNAAENRITNNSVLHSSFDGIQVLSDAPATVLEGNRANRNGDGGIQVDAPTSVLTANTTNHNADLGIEAVPGH
jgi:parallel beta-helix repeat protein